MPFWLLVIYVGLWVGGGVMTLVYRHRLRRQYPELGARLLPGMMERTVRHDMAALRFVMRGEYRRLDDPGFVRLSEAYRALLIAFLVVFVLTMATFRWWA